MGFMVCGGRGGGGLLEGENHWVSAVNQGLCEHWHALPLKKGTDGFKEPFTLYGRNNFYKFVYTLQ